jgi:hypothetical protein
MKKPQSNPRTSADDYLSPGERSLLNSMKRHTVPHPSRSIYKGAPKRKHRRSLAIAAFALSLAAVTPLRAMQPDSAAAPANAAQLLDRAQAESKAGQTAPAILDYERAQWLAPHNEAISNQLANLRAQTGLTAPAQTPLYRATHALSFDALTALASISFLMFALLVFGTRLIPASLRALSRKTAAGFAAIVVVAASGVATRWPELHRAVITADNPSTHIAPADSSTASSVFKPGDIVHTGKAYGPFVRVSSPDGRTGWIRQTSLESIIPNNATHS